MALKIPAARLALFLRADLGNSTQVDLGIRSTQSGAFAPINDAGQVAGANEGSPVQGFLWQGGGVTSLPVLAGTMRVWVLGINASGTVVGHNEFSGGVRHSVRWQGGTVTELSLPWGNVQAINDSGALAVRATSTGQRSYVLSGGSTNRVEVPGLHPTYGTTAALDLNNSNQVCGWFMVNPTVSGVTHAFLWQGGVGTPLLEFNSQGNSTAVSLNNHGHAVGSAWRAANDTPAVLWRDGTVTSLNDLPEVKAAGWSSLTARDINDHDQIVGSGYHNGLLTAFLLSPITAPASISLTISRTATNTIVVSWPASADGCLLEGTNALPSVPVAWWPLVPPPYQTNVGTIFVNFTNTPPVGLQFFRLHKP